MQKEAETISDASATTVLSRLSPNAKFKSLTRLVGGVSANTYVLEAIATNGESMRWVLREHGSTHSGHPVNTEFALLEALHKSGLKVPKPIFSDVSRSHSKYDFLVMDYVRGTSVITANRHRRYITAMAQQLGEIHRQPLESLSNLPNLPQRLDPLPELFDYLPDGAGWVEARRQLGQLAETDYKGVWCLLHGDYWPQNILWQHGEIVSILDWEDAAVGDPLSDVAAASLELRYLFGFAGMQEFITAYVVPGEIDQQRLALWQVYVAAAAQHFMSEWGLEPEREAHMREVALATIREALAMLPKGKY